MKSVEVLTLETTLSQLNMMCMGTWIACSYLAT